MLHVLSYLASLVASLLPAASCSLVWLTAMAFLALCPVTVVYHPSPPHLSHIHTQGQPDRLSTPHLLLLEREAARVWLLHMFAVLPLHLHLIFFFPTNFTPAHIRLTLISPSLFKKKNAQILCQQSEHRVVTPSCSPVVLAEESHTIAEISSLAFLTFIFTQDVLQ